MYGEIAVFLVHNRYRDGIAACRNERDERAGAREVNRFSIAPSKLKAARPDDAAAAASDVATDEKIQPKSAFAQRRSQITSYFETYKRQIFWTSLYTLVTLGVFGERAYCESGCFLDDNASSTCRFHCES